MLSILYFHRQYYNLLNKIISFVDLMGVREKKIIIICVPRLFQWHYFQKHSSIISVLYLTETMALFIFYYQCD